MLQTLTSLKPMSGKAQGYTRAYNSWHVLTRNIAVTNQTIQSP